MDNAALLEERLHKASGEGLEANFARWFGFVGAAHGEWIELQALKVPAYRGHRQCFAHADSIASALALLRHGDVQKAQGVFMIANRVDEAVATRQPPGAWHVAEQGGSTTDRDVTHRRVVFIDVDALRPSGTSATDAQMACTVPLALAVYARLADLLGGEDALGYAHSGNGRQVYIAVEPTKEPSELAALVKGLLAALAASFKFEGAEIDATVSDAKRLVPAFGTVKRKGAPNVPTHPHRQTAFVCADEVVRVSVPALARVLDALAEPLVPEQRRAVDAAMGRKVHNPWRDALKGKHASAGEGTFTRANALAMADVVRELGLLEDGHHIRCPGCGNTGGVGIVGNGLKCQHRTCADRGVPDKAGFRTPVDLVAEVQKIEPLDAAKWLLERLGGGPPLDAAAESAAPRRERARARAVVDDEFLDGPAEGAAVGDCPPSFFGREFPLTDLGNAERFAAHHGDDVRFSHSWNKWLVWDEKHWAVDERKAIQYRARQTARAIAADANRAENEKRRKALKRHALATEGASAMTSMTKLAQCEPRLGVLADDLDANPWLFNCTNGTVNLRTGTLQAHSRADLLTKMAPVAFDPDAKCPRWDAFLSDVMGGNAALVAFLQRAVGYALTGSVDEQVLFFLHGSGSNGKSTFLRAILEIIGDFGLQAAPDLLIAKQHESHPTAIADLFGKRIAVCQELENGRALAEALVKQLTGGDIIRARRMREDFWSFRPTHKLFLAANHKPTIRGTDYAIWRRIRLIPFTVTIPEERKDPNLLEKLLAEREGILRWAVEGCLAWQAMKGLCPPTEVLQATSNYRQEQDVLGDFLEERCERGEHFSVASSALYRNYRAWCEANGHRGLSARSFGMQLLSHQLSAARDRLERRWSGIRLRQPDDDPRGGFGVPLTREEPEGHAFTDLL